MTELFSIHITTENAVAASRALDKAQIPHIGPTFAKFIDSDEAWTVGSDLTAVFEAEDEKDAGQRVRQAVGREPNVVAARPVDAPTDPTAEF
jgi:hypothetical protein